MMNLRPQKRVIVCLVLLLLPLQANSGNDCYHKGMLINKTLPDLIFDLSKNLVLKDLRNAPYAQFSDEQKSLYEQEITRLLDEFWHQQYVHYVAVMKKNSGLSEGTEVLDDCTRCTEILGRLMQTNSRTTAPAVDTVLLQKSEVVRKPFSTLMSKALDFDDIVFNGQKVPATAIRYIRKKKE